MNINNYVLIDCGLIHKYLINKEDIKKIENETFYTVKTIKDLNNYKIESGNDNLIFKSKSEKLIFRKIDNDKYLNYYLDEFNI